MAHNISTPQPISHDSWTLPNSADCKHRMISAAIGVALAAITAVASYFAIVHGLMLLDAATTHLQTFGAGFLIYAGVAFSFVAVGNALYTGGRQLCHGECANKDEPFEYSPREAKFQVGISVLAPIVAIPALIILGLGFVFGSR